ncbi:hypothetical protein FKM82_006405 [Ascaphus truei]
MYSPAHMGGKRCEWPSRTAGGAVLCTVRLQCVLLPCVCVCVYLRSSSSCSQLQHRPGAAAQISSMVRPEHALQSEEEEDEAPEEVTFQSARSEAEESARQALQRDRSEKALLKEKRKHKEELFKEQKKRKLLSDDVLQTVAALKPGDRSDDQDALKEKGDGGRKRRGPKRHAKKLLPRSRLQDNYSVVQLQHYSLMNLQQQKAKAFIQNKLYGAHRKRTTANEFFSISSKKGVVKKAAVKFTDNSWEKAKKKKAKKFNLLWAHKDKL